MERPNKYATTVHSDATPRLLHEQYDSLFKNIVSSGWCVKSDGNVESPQGYFSITEIPADFGELTEMRDAVEEASDLAGWPAAGWYVTIENDQGLIFVYEMSSKIEAWSAFNGLESQYSDWTDAGNLD